jgi:hypothetical protein
VGEVIIDPHALVFVEMISDEISRNIGLDINTEVHISRIAMKHIIERRGPKAYIVVTAINEVISKPSKVVNNSKKRKNSFLFVRESGIVVCVVLEKTKTTWQCQIVSAFLVHPKMYKKMIDISGRAELPPFELPSEEGKNSQQILSDVGGTQLL